MWDVEGSGMVPRPKMVSGFRDKNSSIMVYCMIETNLCPLGPEMWECSTNKGTAAVLPAVIAPSALGGAVRNIVSAKRNIYETSTKHLQNMTSPKHMCQTVRRNRNSSAFHPGCLELPRAT